MKLIPVLLALALAACGSSVTHTETDAGVEDPDAALTSSPPRSELTGGGRMTGGSLVVDVQLAPILP